MLLLWTTVALIGIGACRADGQVALLDTCNSNVAAGAGQTALAVALLTTLLAAVVKRQITRLTVRPPSPPAEVLPPEPEAEPPGIIATGFKPSGLTIRRRLMLGLAIIVCLLLLGSGVSIWQLGRLNQASAALEEESDRISAALQLRWTSSEIASGVEGVAEERDAASLISTVVAAESNLEESAAALRSVIGEPAVGDPTRALLVSIESTLSRLQDTNELLIEHAQAGDWEEVQHHIEETLPRYHSFLARVIDRVTVQAESRRATAAAQAVSARRAAALYAVVSTALALIVTAATAWTTVRSITGPVERLTEGVARLAAGHLDERVPVARRDELGRLAMAFNEMASQLQVSYSKLEQRVAERTYEYEEAVVHTQQAYVQLHETHKRLEVTTHQAQRRAMQLETAAKVSRAATSVLDPDELVRQAVDLIRDRFNLYYTGLFLLDESGRWAVLRAGTGEPGRQMLKANHRLEVGGRSMVGWCTANARARIALDVGEEAVRFDNPLLPETRSEMALPLISRVRVIGALDVQSVEGSAFSDEDIAVLQTMADQIAVAIDNARLLTETRSRLEEVQAAHRSYLQASWDEFLPTKATTSYEHVQPGVTLLREAALPEIEQAMAQRRTMALSGSGDGGGGETQARSALVTPITLRGQVIGALGLQEEEGTRQWTADEIALVESVADQMALAIENARLFEATQARARRERLIHEITGKVQGSIDLDTILRTTVQELGKALGASRAVVRLGTEAELSPPHQVDKRTAGTDQNDQRYGPGVSAEQEEM